MTEKLRKNFHLLLPLLLTLLLNLTWAQIQTQPQAENPSFTPAISQMKLSVRPALLSQADLERLGSLLSSTFFNCSANCANHPDCIGITIFKRFSESNIENGTTSNNPNSEENFKEIGDLDPFWCKMNLSETQEELSMGDVVYKVMFRDKLKKVWRLPLLYRNRQHPATFPAPPPLADITSTGKSPQKRRRSTRQAAGNDVKQSLDSQNTVLDINLHPQNHTLSEAEEARRANDRLMALLTQGLPNPSLAQVTNQHTLPTLTESETPQETVLAISPNFKIGNQSQSTETKQVSIPNLITGDQSTGTKQVNVPNLVVSNQSTGTTQLTVPNLAESGQPIETKQVSIPNLKLSNQTTGTKQVSIPNLVLTGQSTRTKQISIPNLIVGGPPQKTVEIIIPATPLNSSRIAIILNDTTTPTEITKIAASHELESTTTEQSSATLFPDELDKSAIIATTSEAPVPATELIENTTIAIATTTPTTTVEKQSPEAETEAPKTTSPSALVLSPITLDERIGNFTRPSVTPGEASIRIRTGTGTSNGTDEMIFPGDSNRKSSTTSTTVTENPAPATTVESFTPTTLNPPENLRETFTTTITPTLLEEKHDNISSSSIENPVPETETATNKVTFDILMSPSIIPSAIKIKSQTRPEVHLEFTDLSNPQTQAQTEKRPTDSLEMESPEKENIQAKVKNAEHLLNETFTSVSALLKTLAKAASINKKIQENPQIVISTTTTTEPSPFKQLEGEKVDPFSPTDIPPPMKDEVLEVTVAPFPFLQPVSHFSKPSSVADSTPMLDIDTRLGLFPSPSVGANFPKKSDQECFVTDDKERFKRDIISTSFAMVNNRPVMLSFVNGSSCVGMFSKTGQKSVRSMSKFLPDFPAEEKQIIAGAYYNSTVYLFDSDEEQTVWNFFYDANFRSFKEEPQERMTTGGFMEHICGIPSSSNFNIKAIAQFSLTDNSCILFDTSGNIHLSPDASLEAIQLSTAIQSVIKREFLTYVESVFAWLDDSFVSTVYVFGSNDEVYEVYRDETTDFQWKEGSYRIIPYEDFPYR